MKKEYTDAKNTVNKVLAYCRKHTMFQPGDRVVLGVSGGADSICLLFVLEELKRLLDIRLYVVHVNHHVREEAGEDAAFVKQLCDQLQLPFYLEDVDMMGLAAELGVSSEEAGRIARYRAFDRACEEFDCNKIAVAHNSNDRAETMLFHLFRGTGLKGMAGILPVRDRIRRPLLCLEREEIEAYLKVRKLSWRQDSTNATDDYTRNRIRHHILPYARENIVAGSVANMCRAAEVFAQEEAYLQEQVRAAREACVTENISGAGDISYTLQVSAFLEQHPVICRRLLLMLLKALSPGQKDIGQVHVEDVLVLLEREGNRRVELPYGIAAERIYGQVTLERRNQVRKPENGSACAASIPEASGKRLEVPADILEAGREVRIGLADGSVFVLQVLQKPENVGENQLFLEKQYTKWLDYDKMFKYLQVRTRQTGDYLTIRGSGGTQHKKLKDYMLTEKIPAKERDRIFFLAEEHHVIWLPGYRISEHYKVTENTKRILQVQFLQCGESPL